MKALHFLSLLTTHPSEAYGRIEGIADSLLEHFWVCAAHYKADSLGQVLRRLDEVLHIELSACLRDTGLAQIEKEVREGIQQTSADAPFSQMNNCDFLVARLCYALCRATRPANVLETGVCYGVTTAFVLKALDQNRTGVLHSIDLPPLGAEADRYVGKFIPELLRSRWRLHRGTSKRILPRLVNSIGPVSFFIHDSLHTYRNMRRELETVAPLLVRPAIVISDDIQSNPAFSEWVTRVRPEYWGAIQEDSKASLVGVAVLADPRPQIASRANQA